MLRGLGRIQCTDREAAAALGVALNTLKLFFERHPEARDEFDDGKEEGFVSLRRKQFKLAENNAAMAIWLGKQYLGQKDRTELSGDPSNPLQINGVQRLIVDARAGSAGFGETPSR